MSPTAATDADMTTAGVMNCHAKTVLAENSNDLRIYALDVYTETLISIPRRAKISVPVPIRLFKIPNSVVIGGSVDICNFNQI